MLNVVASIFGTTIARTRVSALINEQASDLRTIRKILKNSLSEANQLLEEIYSEELGKRAFAKLGLAKITSEMEKPKCPNPFGNETAEEYKVLIKKFNANTGKYTNGRIKALAGRNDLLFNRVIKDVFDVDYADVELQEITDESVNAIASQLDITEIKTYETLVKLQHRIQFIEAKQDEAKKTE